MLSTGHLLLIFLIVFLLFGAKRLPEIAKSFGHAINEFKKGKDEVIEAVTAAPKKSDVTAASLADSKQTDVPSTAKEPLQKPV